MDTSFYNSKTGWLTGPLAHLAHRRFLVLPLLLACLALPVEAASSHNDKRNETRNELKDLANPSGSSSFAPAPGISVEKATSIARRATGGRVLSATPKQRSAGTEYRVRMLVDGERVVTVTVDHKGRIKNKR
jgi:hypothetical protein